MTRPPLAKNVEILQTGAFFPSRPTSAYELYVVACFWFDSSRNSPSKKTRKIAKTRKTQPNDLTISKFFKTRIAKNLLPRLRRGDQSSRTGSQKLTLFGVELENVLFFINFLIKNDQKKNPKKSINSINLPELIDNIDPDRRLA